ncbi:DUF3644 domain-containing protein [Govanella unica]|uniref:DUF3644 domain-containing protein n=1 Tax=Govanella unica TaxID=2975056 RepID=A0A9X3TWZ1_9PROT|nr:DUF3644 domain-containing protein [Govania unica]MDA5193288.1 DUF3644 domain-containing protein [Govania unica]
MSREGKRIPNDQVLIMRGLRAHFEFNDQDITSIFSHFLRSLNHREVGYAISRHGRYQDVEGVSSQDASENFLRKYGRVIRATIFSDCLNTSRKERLLYEAVEQIICAVSFYNNPIISARAESFFVHAVIAWTKLLQAHYVARKVEPIYENGRWWDIKELTRRGDCPLEAAVKENIKLISDIRDMIEHRVGDAIGTSLHQYVQACALNFSNFIEKKFGVLWSVQHELSFSIQFYKLTIAQASNRHNAVPCDVEAKCLEVGRSVSDDIYNDPAFAFRVYVIPKTTNNPKVADQAVHYRAIGSNAEMAVRDVERLKISRKSVIQILKNEYGKATFNISAFERLARENDLRNINKGFCTKIENNIYWYKDKIVPEFVRLMI